MNYGGLVDSNRPTRMFHKENQYLSDMTTAIEISQLIGGRLEGQEDLPIDGPCEIQNGEKGKITFLGNQKYEPHVYTTAASAIIVPESFRPLDKLSATLIYVSDVYGALGILLHHFGNRKLFREEISSTAILEESAVIGDRVCVGHHSVVRSGANVGSGSKIADHVYIGHNVQIGEEVIIYPGVKIYHDAVIGDRVIIHSNAVIGSDGFGFSRNDQGKYTKIPQIGNVVIEEDVEIGACTVIDRATMGSTTIKRGVKLDNHIQVAHNVTIGEHTVVAAQAGISGSTEIGERCVIGGQAGFVGHIKVADDSMIQAQSGVASHVTKEHSKLYGYPAIDYQQYLKSYAYFKKLPDIVNTIRSMQRTIDKLSNES